MRICFVYCCCRITPQLLKYSTLNESFTGKPNWSFCVDVFPDGAAALTGLVSGFTTHIKGITSECESTY